MEEKRKERKNIRKRMLSNLLRGLHYKVICGSDSVEVRGITDDSRKVEKEHLFVAVKGENDDGHNHIAEAVRNGASAIVAERLSPGFYSNNITFILVENSRNALASIASSWYKHPARKLACIGVTGTNGKSTTAFLIQHILNKCEIPTDLIGTVFYDIGGKKYPSSNTTPGILFLQKSLAESIAAKREALVMEVSSHSLVQGRTEGISFASAVLTNIASDHLDYHKTHRDYVEAKKLLFKSLPQDSVAIINRDSPHWEEFAECCKASVVTYSIKNEDALVKAKASLDGFSGIRLSLEVEEENAECNFPLIGLHNCENALAAVSVGYFGFGLSLVEIANALESFGGVPGRLELVSDINAPFKVVVDYAHTEGALEAALKALRPLCEGRLILIFGCGGDRDRTKRPRMAQVAERIADIVVVTSDNPRTEDPMRIIIDIMGGFNEPGKHKAIVDRREAIDAAIRMARKGDVVLIAGKGHENYQIVQNRILPFNDRDEVRRALENVA